MKTVEQVREGSVNIPRQCNGLIAVIVSTKYSPRKSSLGVQFWKQEEIDLGVSGASYFVEVL